MSDPDAQAEVGRLLAGMLGRTWFVAVSEEAPGGPPVSDHLLEHLKAQIALEKQGLLVGAGPLVDADGTRRGMFVLRCADREEAIRVLDADPLHASGARRYTLHEWQVNEGRFSVTVNFSDQSVDIG